MKSNCTTNKYIIAILSILVVFCSCSRQENPDELIIAAATNLQYALKEIGDNFTRNNEISIIFVWSSSGSLANQIPNGAPYDIFFSANKSMIEPLRSKGFFLDEHTVTFAGGQIAIGIPANNRNRITGTPVTLKDFVNPGMKRIVIASPDHAPFGIAAKEALTNQGLWDKIKSKLLYAENIRQCLQFIQTGNADAGIISSNIPSIEGILVFPIEPSLYTPPEQTAAILKNSPNTEAAIKFLNFLRDKSSTDILEKYNYTILR